MTIGMSFRHDQFMTIEDEADEKRKGKTVTGVPIPCLPVQRYVASVVR